MVTVIKRDGTLVDFDISKIINAILKASKSVHEIPSSAIEIMAKSVENKVKNHDKISVEFIQDEVEKILIENNYSDIAKSYILYRDQRTRARDASSYITNILSNIVNNDSKDSDLKRENGNINADTSAGTMYKFGAESSKWFALEHLIRPEIAKLHKEKFIHINDLDYYAWGTCNCVSSSTRIILKDPNGKLINTEASYFSRLGEGIHYLKGWKILSRNNQFVDLINVAIRQEKDHINVIKSVHGYIEVTDNHIVPVIRDNKEIEVLAKDVKIGDKLIDADISSDSNDQIYEINLLDIFANYNNIFIIESDYLKNILISNNLINEFLQKTSNILRLQNQPNKKISLIEYTYFRDEFIRLGVDEKKLNISLSFNDANYIPAVLPLTREFGRFIGLLYSEGCVGKDFIHITNSDINIINFIRDFVIKFFPNVNYYCKPNRNNCFIFTVSGKIFNLIFRHGALGYHFGSGNLQLSDICYTANVEFLKGFIGGYLDGDGNIDIARFTSLITSDKKFSKQLQYILSILHITSGITETLSAGTIANFGKIKSIRKFNNYRIFCTNRDICNLNLYDSIKATKLLGNTFANKSNKNYNIVRTIDKVKYNGLVYDFETGDHFFVANNQILHNCIQLPIGDLLKRGFHTGHGFIRPPQTIGTAVTQAAIILQSNQNEMYQ